MIPKSAIKRVNACDILIMHSYNNAYAKRATLVGLGTCLERHKAGVDLHGLGLQRRGVLHGVLAPLLGPTVG